MATWKEVRMKLNLTEEDANIIESEKDIIRTMVKMREEERLDLAAWKPDPCQDLRRER